MNCYFMKLSARVYCDCCKSKILVEVSEELDAEECDLYDLDSQIKDAIETQKDNDGWHGDYCPKCAQIHAARFAAEQDADDYCSNTKEDIY